VQLLRPRGHRARGRSAGRGGVLSPHRRLGGSRTASTREHREPCTAQREAPESRQPHQAEMMRRAAPTLPSTPTVAPPPRPAQIHTARALKARERAPWCRRHQWRTRQCRPAPSSREETTVLAPRCEEPALPSGAPKQRPHRPADPHRGFKRVSPKSRQRGVRPRAAPGGAAARSPRRPNEPTRGWRGGAGTPGPTLG